MKATFLFLFWAWMKNLLFNEVLTLRKSYFNPLNTNITLQMTTVLETSTYNNDDCTYHLNNMS